MLLAHEGVAFLCTPSTADADRERSCFVDSETDIHLPDPLRLPTATKRGRTRRQAGPGTSAFGRPRRCRAVPWGRPRPRFVPRSSRRSALSRRSRRLGARKRIVGQGDAPALAAAHSNSVGRAAGAPVCRRWCGHPGLARCAHWRSLFKGSKPSRRRACRRRRASPRKLMARRRIARSPRARNVRRRGALFLRLDHPPRTARAPESSGDHHCFDRLERPADPAAVPRYGRDRPGDHSPHHVDARHDRADTHCRDRL